MANLKATVTLTGRSKFGKQLEKLGDSVLRSAEARRVNYSAAAEAQKIIKAGAPSVKGISAAKGWPSIKDGVMLSQRGMPAWVWHSRKNPVGLWLEHGTSGAKGDPRKHESGKSTGKMTATHWWSIARNKARTPVRRILTKGYKKIVEGVAIAR